jgi:hypothetical protein
MPCRVLCFTLSLLKLGKLKDAARWHSLNELFVTGDGETFVIYGSDMCCNDPSFPA